MMEIELKSIFVALTLNPLTPPTSRDDPFQVVGSQTSKKAEFIVNERRLAIEVRASWMRKMGFAEEEIVDACADDGSPISLADEQEQLYYANKLKDITPPRSVLESWAVKF